MLHHQDQPLNSAYGSSNSSSSFQNRKCDKDGNFNFLPRKDDEDYTGNVEGGGDENRNQVRPRNLRPLGRDPPNSGVLSPRSRMSCWSRLEQRSFSRKSLPGSNLGNLEERAEDQDDDDDQSSDSDGEMPELMDTVWTLRDRERFKAQEMEKHQVQLTMYRRLALIRWVRTLQGRVQEQQNRLQSSFDVILTHRKELLRMGAAKEALCRLNVTSDFING
uniref:Uncharacterized protein n=1 Tax=Maylandia zebra TaxID=106582 RepID=A0A3P9DLP4_9CICH